VLSTSKRQGYPVFSRNLILRMVTYMYVDLSFKFGSHHENGAAQGKDAYSSRRSYILLIPGPLIDSRKGLFLANTSYAIYSLVENPLDPKRDRGS
jgi:hypothetical protein